MPALLLEALFLTNETLECLDAVFKVIDNSWFHQAALPEEEMYRQLVQQ